jgi:conserved oligomeric Golgi complex subunit 3
LYAKFSSLSGPTAPLLAELERRTGTHPDDLSSLLSECHTAYFVARKALIAGRLTNEIRMLDPGKSDLVELVSFCRVTNVLSY